MRAGPKITTLFLDIGGVLLSDGWGRVSRRAACEKFGLSCDEMNERHNITFEAYEKGKIDLEKYLQRVVFYKKRDFTPEEFRAFMFSRSTPFQETIDFFIALKERDHLRVAALSNEGRELTEYRVNKFSLHRLIDFFVSSCFVRLRKPDEEIYRLALDLASVKPSEVLYIEDRAIFLEPAKWLGIKGIHHTDLNSTKTQLAEYSLLKDEPVPV